MNKSDASSLDPAKSSEFASRLKRVRIWISIFIVGLVLSGITAFPLETELRWLDSVLHAHENATGNGSLYDWIDRVRYGLVETNGDYPFLAYGTDWLAFAHLVIAVAFIGPLRDPIRNIWVIEFGLIACAMVPFLALIAGPLRGIPIYWRLIDCSFGVLGAIPLWICRREIKRLEALSA